MNALVLGGIAYAAFQIVSGKWQIGLPSSPQPQPPTPLPPGTSPLPSPKGNAPSTIQPPTVCGTEPSLRLVKIDNLGKLRVGFLGANLEVNGNIYFEHCGGEIAGFGGTGATYAVEMNVPIVGGTVASMQSKFTVPADSSPVLYYVPLQLTALEAWLTSVNTSGVFDIHIVITYDGRTMVDAWVNGINLDTMPYG